MGERRTSSLRDPLPAAFMLLLLICTNIDLQLVEGARVAWTMNRKQGSQHASLLEVKTPPLMPTSGERVRRFLHSHRGVSPNANRGMKVNSHRPVNPTIQRNRFYYLNIENLPPAFATMHLKPGTRRKIHWITPSILAVQKQRRLFTTITYLPLSSSNKTPAFPRKVSRQLATTVLPKHTTPPKATTTAPGDDLLFRKRFYYLNGSPKLPLKAVQSKASGKLLSTVSTSHLDSVLPGSADSLIPDVPMLREELAEGRTRPAEKWEAGWQTKKPVSQHPHYLTAGNLPAGILVGDVPARGEQQVIQGRVLSANSSVPGWSGEEPLPGSMDEEPSKGKALSPSPPDFSVQTPPTATPLPPEEVEGQAPSSGGDEVHGKALSSPPPDFAVQDPVETSAPAQAEGDAATKGETPLPVKKAFPPPPDFSVQIPVEAPEPAEGDDDAPAPLKSAEPVPEKILSPPPPDFTVAGAAASRASYNHLHHIAHHASEEHDASVNHRAHFAHMRHMAHMRGN